MPPGIGYANRPSPKKRAQAGVMREANIDTTGIDPEMFGTLAQESARRVGARGIQVQTKNPMDKLMGMFKKKAKK